MMYSELTVGGNDYKLRLDARACISLERKLGKSPLSIFMDSKDGSLPKLEDMILILHAALQKYNKGFNEDKTYDLYDTYVEDGNVFTDFIPVIMDVFKVSGFFKEEDAKAAEGEVEKK